MDIELEEAFRGATRTLELRRPEAGADGRVELRNHTVRVTIPAGVTEGQLIRLAGQGAPGAGGGAAGDLYLEAHILPNKLYALDGRDVTLTLPLAPWEAALGASVTVPTLGGAVQMQIPAGAQSGQKLRLRGRGLPGKPPGDEYVQLKIVLPPAEQRRSQGGLRRDAREAGLQSARRPGGMRWYVSHTCSRRTWSPTVTGSGRPRSASCAASTFTRCRNSPSSACSSRASSGEDWQVPAAALPRLRIVGALMRDLGLNVSGAALALELLEPQRALERRIRELEHLGERH